MAVAQHSAIELPKEVWDSIHDIVGRFDEAWRDAGMARADRIVGLATAGEGIDRLTNRVGHRTQIAATRYAASAWATGSHVPPRRTMKSLPR